MKLLSVSIWPVNVPTAGPAVNSPLPETVYPSPLSITDTDRSNILLGPITFPVKLANLDSTSDPAIIICIPEIFVSTLTSPETSNVLGSILKLLSAVTSPRILP